MQKMKGILSFVTTVVFFICLPHYLQAQPTTSGPLVGDETWSGNITLTGDVTIPVGTTLTIEPGTTVLFTAYSDDQAGGNQTTLISLEVMGDLIASGTASEPILFTSTVSGEAAWDQIRFLDLSPTGIIEHCIIENAVVGIHLHSGYADIVNNTIVKNSWSGIMVQNSNPTIKNNIVVESGYGINVDANTSTPHISYNNVYSNFRNYWDQIAGQTYTPSPGTGNISTDSLFVDFDGADYHLQDGSPCIDAGDPAPQYNDPDGSRNDMGAYSFLPEVELIGLEVNQAIQDWNNSVTLVKDKTTVVRAHIQAKGNDPVQVSTRLRGFRGGVELPGSPLAAINPGGSIIARPDAVAWRGVTEASANFQLPPSWAYGTVELRLAAVGGGLECREAAGTPNDCIVEVTFVPTDEPQVKFVRFGWMDDTYLVHGPSESDVNELVERLRAIWPVDRIDLDTHALGIVTYDADGNIIPPSLSSINLHLEAMRANDACLDSTGCNRLYYGVLVNHVGGSLGLANGIPGTVASGYMPPNPFDYGRNRAAHELGHTLERHHTVDPALPQVLRGLNWYKQGPCGSLAGLTAPNFPYIFNIGGNDRATIGPMNLGDDSMIYGYDTHSLQAVDPHLNFELMSYCGGIVGGWRWISDFTYDGLRAEINNRFPSSPISWPREIGHILIRGRIYFRQDTADFLPFGLLFASHPLPAPPPGDYTLELRDGGGNLIESISFQPNEYHVDFSDEDPGEGSFLIPVPANPNIKEVVILRNGEAQNSISASASLPTVEVVYPNGGESLIGDKVVSSWTGSDLDGDSLTYTVQYSSDGGDIWQTLIVDHLETSYEIDLSLLKGSSSGLLRVIASDGFNTADDESDATFTVQNNKPQLFILSPKENSLFFGAQQIIFEATAQDREDGRLDGQSLQWMSNINGYLGDGSYLNMVATTLSEGSHVITVTAEDSGGLIETASVNIRVFRAVQVEGLQEPLVGLVLEGQNVPYPEKAFKRGRTLPLKLQLFCNSVSLADIDVSPPEIVGLAKVGEASSLDTVDLDAGAANDMGPYFRYSDENWIYNLSTKGMESGDYILRLFMPDGHLYATGFTLR